MPVSLMPRQPLVSFRRYTMKANEIKVGGVYIAKVNNKLQKVRVDDIRLTFAPATPSAKMAWTSSRDVWVYDVTNLATGCKTTFRSPAKFRSEVKSAPTFGELYGAEEGGVP